MRKPSKPKPYVPLEKDIQRTCVEYLRVMGYKVLVTNVALGGVCVAGKWHYPKSGQIGSAGIPDLLVTHRSWHPWEWLGIEMKRPGGRVRPEQQEMIDAGDVSVANCLEDVQAIVKIYNATRNGLVVRSKQ